ncbi:MAG: dihydroorotate dehydrogenase (quinone), partial [Verrucomicrobiales bacterium]|nr:dihydroorotate dehydrogenase (quinone) [Verrucomicrobiales bacterium]
ATNTTISRDAVRGLHHGTEAGGLSGAPLTERSNAMVRLLAGHLGGALPIIGVGGIMTPQDALERLDSGAALVQVYTGLVYHGPPLIKETIDSVRIRRNTSRANASIKP